MDTSSSITMETSNNGSAVVKMENGSSHHHSSSHHKKHKKKHKKEHRDDKHRHGHHHSSKHKHKDKDRNSTTSNHHNDKKNHHSKVDIMEMSNNHVVKEDKEIKKEESSSEDDLPLTARLQQQQNSNNNIKVKKEEESDDDDKPLAMRTPPPPPPTKNKTKKRRRHRSSSSSSSSSFSKKKQTKKRPHNSNHSTTSSSSPSKKKKKKNEEEEEVWRWWEEGPPQDSSVKWKFLEHKGPLFAPEYERLPKSVKFRYEGKEVELSEEAEEVAGFYARFLEHDYVEKDKFRENFFKDWRRVMTPPERNIIKSLTPCDFTQINTYYKQKAEERKQMSKEEKQKIKEQNEEIQKLYGVCTLDGHKEKIGNFRIEPPGLFRGRGDHPKMGMLKKRVRPEDVIINCSKDAVVPEVPKEAGKRWKEVRHDNTVTWLACWTENVQGQTKYVMLNPTSRLKGEKDWLKYEKARTLAKYIGKIRVNYKEDFKSKEMRVRQRAVALYFIDVLALRAGNEKDSDDTADTVGCCSLRVEHIQLHDEKEGKQNVVVFDFLGKDSIRYYNEVEVERRVYKNVKIFMEGKKPGDDLFDRLNTQILNKHLTSLMDGLTAKVFRTYNASHTLQQQLDKLTPKDGTPVEKLLAYNRANRAVAVLCNHQRSVPKGHEKSMENLVAKIDGKRKEVKKVKKEVKEMRKGSKDHEKKTAQLKRLEEQLKKLEMNKLDKEEGKEIALGTSKLNYLDPRISVAWCKKHDIPIEKVYNKTQRAKFRWAIDMAESDFKFD